MEDDIELRYGTVCTVAEELSEEALLECIRTADAVNQPQFVPNKSVEIVEDDFEAYEIMYSDGELQPPSEPLVRSVFQSDIFREEIFHVHSYLDAEIFEDGIQQHWQMMGGVDEFTLAVFTNTYTTDREVDDVISTVSAISIDDQAGEIGAISFNQDKWQITISDEPMETTITVSNTSGKEVKRDEFEDELQSHKKEAWSKVTEVFE